MGTGLAEGDTQAWRQTGFSLITAGVSGGPAARFSPIRVPRSSAPTARLTASPQASGGLAVYDPVFAARQTLNNGRAQLEDLRRLVPQGVPDTFHPSPSITSGSKYRFVVDGTRIEVKWHGPDANAAAKFPGSNAGSYCTAYIKIGKKLLGAGGKLYSKPSNITHILME